MKKHSPKKWLAISAIVGVALTLSFVAHGQPKKAAPPVKFSKEAMLRNVVENLIVPGYRKVAEGHKNLRIALETVKKNPGADTMETARKVWIETLMEDRAMQCFEFGPIADNEYATDFYFWKISPFRIEEFIGGKKTINDDNYDRLGAPGKGMFAIEYLLFDKEGSVKTADPDASSARRRDYLLYMAKDLEQDANSLVEIWSAKGADSTGETFIKGGQDSLTVFVNQLCWSIEQATEHRIRLYLGLPMPIERQLDRVEGSRSGTSHMNLIATFDALDRAYRGGDGLGLDDFLAHLGVPLKARIEAMLADTRKTSQAIGRPLEKAIADRKTRPLVIKASRRCHTLERLFKLDLTSATGVTLLFSSNDGDG
jgi:predicted lipoprotein